MTAYFFDTSAYVKRYVRERGSDLILSLCRNDQHELFLCRLACPEVVAALTRRFRDGDLSERDYRGVLDAFRAHLGDDLLVIEATVPVMFVAMDLARAHALRGADAVHLAAAVQTSQLRRQLGLSPMVFACSDGDLIRAARALGFSTLNPEEGQVGS